MAPRRYQPDLDGTLEEILSGGTISSGLRRLAAAGYVPVDVYSGRSREPVAACCGRCGAVVTVVVAELAESEDHACGQPTPPEPDLEPLKPYVYKAQRRRAPQSRTLSAREVLELSRYRYDHDVIPAAGLIEVECMLCDARLYVSVQWLRRQTALRQGAPRQVCHHKSRMLVGARPEPVPLQVRPQTYSEAECRQILDAHDYDPVGDFPGIASEPWHARCRQCGAEVWITPASQRPRPVRKQCHHPFSKIIKPSRARLEAAERAAQSTQIEHTAQED